MGYFALTSAGDFCGGLRLELLHQIERLAALLFQTPVIGFHDRAIAAVIGIGIGAALRSAENGN